MKIVNDELTDSYLVPGKCRFCGKPCQRLCAHHIWSKGAGQVDIRSNLISLGLMALLDCACHVSHHAGNEPTFEQLLALSAMDHDCLQADIEDLVMLIRRMPPIRDVTEAMFVRTVEKELSFSAKRLALAELKTFRHLLREA